MPTTTERFYIARRFNKGLHELCKQVQSAVPQIAILYEYLGRKARVMVPQNEGQKFDDAGPLFGKRFCNDDPTPLSLLLLTKSDADREERYARLYYLPCIIPYLPHQHRLILKTDQLDTDLGMGLRLLQGVFCAYRAEQVGRAGKKAKVFEPTREELDETIEFYCLASRILHALHPKVGEEALNVALQELRQKCHFCPQGGPPQINFCELPYLTRPMKTLFAGPTKSEGAYIWRRMFFDAIVYMHGIAKWFDTLSVPAKQREYLEYLYAQTREFQSA